MIQDKYQITSTKLQISSKLQLSISKHDGTVAFWFLENIWDLDVIIWSFILYRASCIIKICHPPTTSSSSARGPAGVFPAGGRARKTPRQPPLMQRGAA